VASSAGFADPVVGWLVLFGGNPTAGPAQRSRSSALHSQDEDLPALRHKVRRALPEVLRHRAQTVSDAGAGSVSRPNLPYELIDEAGLGSVLFYPRPDPVPPPPGARDISFDAGAGVALGARFYAADPGLPTVLYFHGNGEVASDHDQVAAFYRQAGANLLVCEFRGYGRSSGRPSFAALISDAHPVVEQFHALLDAEGFAAGRFVMGRSMGANTALEIAANAAARFRGVIIESGAGNVRRLAARAGLPEDDPRVTALVEGHEAKLAAITIPTLIIHGQRDELIPLPFAAELHGLLTSSETEMVVIAGAGHNDILWVGLREYFAAIAAFIERYR
jgi:pimeloyl-ACP methyl ester carboxylesterase